MTQKVTWKLDVSVAAGPKVTENGSVEAEAYDKISVLIPANSTKTVQVQPGGPGQVQLLLIKSDQYGQIWYSINDDVVEDEASRIALDTLQMFMGRGAADALGQPLQTFNFQNGNEETGATVEILVARQATTGEGENGNSDGETDGETNGETDGGTMDGEPS